MEQELANQEELVRVENQKRLLDLAGIYKHLNRRELARALGRDASNLLPANGNPKLDYVVRLAQVLDWPVGDVAEAIWGGGETAPGPDEGEPEAFDSLDRAATEAHRRGDYARMCEMGRRMAAAAATPDQRALAALREAGGWDGLGRYTRQLETIRRGLHDGPISSDLRSLLEVNFANAHYTLWYLFEARAMSRDLIARFHDNHPTGRRERAAEAFAWYILGHTWRRLMARQPENCTQCADAAREALQQSVLLYTKLADEFNHDPWRGIAHTCRGGILEAEAALGVVSGEQAVAAVAEALEAVGGPEDGLAGDRLESRGWWCIFGCNIALRHLDDRELQRHMAMFTRKGYEIANRLDNWAMRERLFTLDYLQRQRLNDLAGFPVDWTVDSNAVQAIVGTMGRFPAFRSTAWRILQTAAVVQGT